MQHYTDRDLDQMYQESLDSFYDVVTIAGYTYSTSHALRLVDPTAYRCGFNDWLDMEIANQSIFEHDDGEYYSEPQNADEEE